MRSLTVLGLMASLFLGSFVVAHADEASCCNSGKTCCQSCCKPGAKCCEK